ncbi:hypothetical protein TNCV_4051501 [Trichonephila clavipes]|nr:hypothetical protein TNCV_4051501 [Trichonephila clavipes]
MSPDLDAQEIGGEKKRTKLKLQRTRVSPPSESAPPFSSFSSYLASFGSRAIFSHLPDSCPFLCLFNEESFHYPPPMDPPCPRLATDSRAFGDELRNFEPWSSDEDDSKLHPLSLLPHHTNGRKLKTTDLTCNGPFNSVGLQQHRFRLITRQPRVRDLAEWPRYRIVAGLVTSSSSVPLNTHQLGQRCMLNLSRAQTSSRGEVW